MMAALHLQPCQPPGADEWDCLLDIKCGAVRMAATPINRSDGALEAEATAASSQVEVWYGLAYGVLQVDTACYVGYESIHFQLARR